MSAGNTPTGVGKTRQNGGLSIFSQKHPHGRGEDDKTVAGVRVIPETPPRAWGRPIFRAPNKPLNGNTPTGVGKTGGRGTTGRVRKKHPHGRGEDGGCLSAVIVWGETPPRAWGRLQDRAQRLVYLGNTPTGVGKTDQVVGWTRAPGKHPHGRGEDQTTRHHIQTPLGNTPTGVGKTNRRPYSGTACRKHPHGRGEDIHASHHPRAHLETPPRAWGRHRNRRTPCTIKRNTPTGVGKTL